MININDVVVPTKGTGKWLQVKALNFDISPTNGIKLYWAVFSEVLVPMGSGDPVSKPNQLLMDGNLHYPQSEYDDWGTDDSVVTNWVMTQLGFTEVQ